MKTDKETEQMSADERKHHAREAAGVSPDE